VRSSGIQKVSNASGSHHISKVRERNGVELDIECRREPHSQVARQAYENYSCTAKCMNRDRIAEHTPTGRPSANQSYAFNSAFEKVKIELIFTGSWMPISLIMIMVSIRMLSQSALG
jgi:hypothetical protein